MKALTLHQPWAWAICHAGKRIENRDWPPPRWLVGEDFGLHAGKHYDHEGAGWIKTQCGITCPPPAEITLGAVEAVARLDSSIQSRTMFASLQIDPDQERWFFGEHGWLLSDVRVLPTPVPCRGYQKIWTLDPDTEAEVFHQLGKIET